MLLLTGEFDLNLDEKNRLALPVRIRDELTRNKLSNAFYLTLGTNRVLNLYPETVYQQIALVVAPRTGAPDELLAHDRVNFSLASRVELDRQGRLLLGERYIRRAGLSQQIVLIGARDHLEIWDLQRWDTFLTEHFGEHEKIILSAREAVLRNEYEATESHQTTKNDLRLPNINTGAND